MIYLVIPCYNAQLSLQKLIGQVSEHIAIDRTICVNDGSTDRTKDILNRLESYNHHFQQNQGKGRCLKQGLEMALSKNASKVLTIDSDLQHDPNDIPKFIKAAKDFDIVIGSRRNKSNRFSKPMPINRRLSNTITSTLLTNVCNQPIWDSQCGYRLISAKCIKEILPLCHETGFMFETEFLIHAARRGYSVGFVGIETIYTSAKSHMRYLADTFNFVKLMLRHSIHKSVATAEQTPQKVITQ